jgi:hypothetical protein
MHYERDGETRRRAEVAEAVGWLTVVLVMELKSRGKQAVAASPSNPSRRRTEKAGEVSQHLVHLRWRVDASRQ